MRRSISTAKNFFTSVNFSNSLLRKETLLEYRRLINFVRKLRLYNKLQALTNPGPCAMLIAYVAEVYRLEARYGYAKLFPRRR